ncbi:MAG: hypothetical protein LBG61_03950 [Burkholderiales bacterium]|jgi:hypothetical protein|nr:hypothetical protein [Burkholderiales bacterium]
MSAYPYQKAPSFRSKNKGAAKKAPSLDKKFEAFLLRAQAERIFKPKAAPNPKLFTKHNKRRKSIALVEDYLGDVWWVYTRMPTKHGFKIHKGRPEKLDGKRTSSTTVIPTPDLIQYLRNVSYYHTGPVDLPLSINTITRLYRKYCKIPQVQDYKNITWNVFQTPRPTGHGFPILLGRPARKQDGSAGWDKIIPTPPLIQFLAAQIKAGVLIEHIDLPISWSTIKSLLDEAKIKPDVTSVKDYAGVKWNVYQTVPTRHGFTIYRGKLANVPPKEQPRIPRFIVTPALAKYLKAHPDYETIDLPIARKKLYELRRLFNIKKR